MLNTGLTKFACMAPCRNDTCGAMGRRLLSSDGRIKRETREAMTYGHGSQSRTPSEENRSRMGGDFTYPKMGSHWFRPARPYFRGFPSTSPVPRARRSLAARSLRPALAVEGGAARRLACDGTALPAPRSCGEGHAMCCARDAHGTGAWRLVLSESGGENCGLEPLGGQVGCEFFEMRTLGCEVCQSGWLGSESQSAKWAVHSALRPGLELIPLNQCK